MRNVYHSFYDTNYDYDIPEELAEELDKKLPHGSGINGDWNLEFDAEHKTIVASSAFHAMNENGYYCHVWPFRVAIPVICSHSKNELKPIAINMELKSKIEFEFVDCDPENDCPTKAESAEYFAEFEKNEYGDYDDNVYENAPIGCGVGLGEYLDELIYYHLTEK